MTSKTSLYSKLALLVLGYLLLAQAGTLLYASGTGVAYFWPANALTFAILCHTSTRQWPLLLAGVAVAEIGVDRYHALPWITSAGLALANALEAGAGAWLARRWIGAPVQLNSLNHLKRFMAVVLVSPALSAWVGAGALHYGGEARNYWHALTVWWIGDALGLLLVTPVLLTLTEFRQAKRDPGTPMRFAEVLLLALGLGVTAFVVLGANSERGVGLALVAYVVFPFIVWIALRFGLALTTWAVAVGSVIVAWNVEHRLGPFASVSSAWQVLAAQMFLASAGVTGLVLAVTVAERRRAEASFRAVVESAPSAFLMVDRQGVIVLVNAQAERILGYSRQELLNSSIDMLVPERLRSTHEQNRAAFLAAPEARQMGMGRDLHALRKDGSEVEVEIGLSPISTDQGLMILAAVVDVSARKRAEAALRASEERLRTITDNIPALVSYMDAHGRFVFCNKLFEEWSGQPHSTRYGRTVAEVEGEAAGAQVQRYIERVLAGEKVSFERDFRPLGVAQDREVTYVPNFDLNGRVVGYYALAIDITERNKQRAQIEAALAEKTVLLNEIHHRVKNNLQIVSGLLYLQGSKTTDPRLKALLEEAQNRIDAMAIIHQLLYEGGDVGRVRLRTYLQRLAHLLASSYGAEARRIALRVDVDDVALDMQTSVPVGLLVNELISNALKHAFAHGQGGEVRLELHRGVQADEVTLSVSDTGIGLPADIDPTHAKSLGLRLVTSLAEQIGAQLEVQRQQGTRFSLRFSCATRNRGVAQA